jgi:hypothetical protein
MVQKRVFTQPRAAANPARASRLQSWRLAGRVAELLGRCMNRLLLSAVLLVAFRIELRSGEMTEVV